MREPRTRARVRYTWLALASCMRANHLGRKPSRGGRPAKERREIRATEEGFAGEPERSVTDFMEKRVLELNERMTIEFSKR